MGAYSYCATPDCGCGLKPATAFDIMRNHQECPAGHINSPPNRTLAEVVYELEERLAVLEGTPE